jgi:hypothetical protein
MDISANPIIRTQNVIEIMGNPTGKGTDGFRLLGLEQLSLGFTFFGNRCKIRV